MPIVGPKSMHQLEGGLACFGEGFGADDASDADVDPVKVGVGDRGCVGHQGSIRDTLARMSWAVGSDRGQTSIRLLSDPGLTLV